MKKGIVNKAIILTALASASVVATPMVTSAHVVVSPHDALTGEYETFTTSVPNEKDIAVTGIRVVIPDTIESVTPTVKPGWDIQTKKSGEKITEISWTGGSIGPELRDEFSFSAHLPTAAGELHWKAYQTYQDGTVVSWDQKPSGDGHGHGNSEGKGPYSTTTVSEEATTESHDAAPSNALLYVLGFGALVVGVAALIRTTRK